MFYLLHITDCLLDRTAVALRVFNVADGSAYKYQVFADDVNVSTSTPRHEMAPLALPHNERDQDYFVAPAQEWIFGTRFDLDPKVVRQFQVHQGVSGYVSAKTRAITSYPGA